MPWPDHGYERFRRQHIDSPASWDDPDPTEYCNEMMPDRINRPTPPENSKKPPCKWTNTFIHAPEEEIRAVCQPEGGTHKTDNLFLSKEPFKLTVCTKSSGRKPACEYEGERRTAKIKLGCSCYPVHFEPLTEEEPIALGPSQP
ncbi:ribonuclease-like [Pelodiscus sinensis]|uniref:ribonuclease-like n=1 Tax=Pelodiscus sinensis TaxID=13735 RepID=UPI003F6D1DE8